jgi:hypothetical protein
MSLTGTVVKHQNFDWQMTLNASTLENKITKMPEQIQRLSQEQRNWQKGIPFMIIG